MAASAGSNSSGASRPDSRRQPKTISLPSLSLPPSYGCGKCPQSIELPEGELEFSAAW
jgi:hypothetical protein